MAVKTDKRSLERKLRSLEKSLTDRRSRFLTGKFIVDMIVKRTRDEGKGVNRTGANKATLKPVSEAWAIRRQMESRHPKAATGLKSNLTQTGKMLDSLTVVRATKDQLFIGFKSQKESDKAKGNADRGRPFMFLSKGEITKTSDFIKKQLLRNV